MAEQITTYTKYAMAQPGKETVMATAEAQLAEFQKRLTPQQRTMQERKGGAKGDDGSGHWHKSPLVGPVRAPPINEDWDVFRLTKEKWGQ